MGGVVAPVLLRNLSSCWHVAEGCCGMADQEGLPGHLSVQLVCHRNEESILVGLFQNLYGDIDVCATLCPVLN